MTIQFSNGQTVTVDSSFIQKFQKFFTQISDGSYRVIDPMIENVLRQKLTT